MGPVRARRWGGLVAAVWAATLGIARPAAAEEEEGEGAATEERERDPFRIKPGYAQLFATTFVGEGLRFNNPYRLATPLGATAESVSRTAPYVDLGLAVTFGNPLGLQHGGALRASVALQGVGQAVLSPSYLAWRRWRALALYGRAGTPVVATPSVTWGLEAGLGAAWFLRGGVGLAAEVVGDVFYGAGTRDKATVTYPVLSGQLGLVIAYEVFP
jgi:hypothetical protein